MSCASCHKDAKHDGRVWDFTHLGEGLRNTPSLLGKSGMSQGMLHWSGNFDELQDFEGQIRAFSGGTGLMSDDDFYTGTRSLPLGDTKAGLSTDLDALAAYIESLDEVGKHISKSQEAWDTAHKRLSTGKGNLVRRTEELKKLGAKAKKSLPESAGLDAFDMPAQLADDSDLPESKD